MIEPEGPLSLSRQCVLLGVSRSSLYYRPKGESAENLALMRRMDELHMDYPFYGSRQMMRHLRREREPPRAGTGSGGSCASWGWRRPIGARARA